MQSSVLKIKVLTGLGLAGLAACLYFSFPLYGYLIWATLLGIFLYTQYKNLINLNSAQKEIEFIQELKETDADIIPESDSIIFQRYSILKNLKQTNESVDLSAFSDILSARTSSKISSSAANLTITLGLLGTFFGLMGAISTAGSSMTESFKIQTLIVTIFSDMNGIFGTSLTGLIAFMVLSIANSVVRKVYIEMMSEVEEYTHFYLIPRFSSKSDGDQATTMLEKLEKNLSGFVNQLGEQLQTNAASLSSAITEKLERSIDKLQSSIESSNNAVVEKMSSTHKSVLDDIIAQHKHSAQEVVETQKTLLTTFGNQVQESAAQILEAQKELTHSSADSIREKLDSLKEVIAAIPEMQRDLANSGADSIREKLDGLSNVIATIPQVQKDTIREQIELLDKHQEQSRELQKEYMAHNQDQMDTVFEKTTEFTESLKESINMISKEGFTKLQEEFVTLAQAAKENFEIQEKLGKELESQYANQVDILQSFAENISEGGSLMKINQVEFQAALEMFTHGVESLLEHVSSSEPEEQSNFYEKLESTLEAFHEKASEVLIENALKTQEILIEVLEQVKVQGESLENVDQGANV